jgi:hypothetical protein
MVHHFLFVPKLHYFLWTTYTKKIQIDCNRLIRYNLFSFLLHFVLADNWTVITIWKLWRKSFRLFKRNYLKLGLFASYVTLWNYFFDPTFSPLLQPLFAYTVPSPLRKAWRNLQTCPTVHCCANCLIQFFLLL